MCVRTCNGKVLLSELHEEAYLLNFLGTLQAANNAKHWVGCQLDSAHP